MIPFDPQDWTGGSGWFDWRNNDSRKPEDLNRAAVQRWLAASAFCLCFAALGPPHLLLHAFAGLQFLAALASAAVAVLRRDDPSVPHLTAWDEAAASLFAGIGLNMALGPPPSA
jgi:hypothetical protein